LIKRLISERDEAQEDAEQLADACAQLREPLNSAINGHGEYSVPYADMPHEQ